MAVIAAGAAIVSQLVPVPRSPGASPAIMAAPDLVVERGSRPLPVRERFERERERTGVANLSGEAAIDEGNAYEQWFFEQRTFPDGVLPVNAVGAALEHAKSKNNDVRGAPGGGGPMWKPLGPVTIPDGQTDDSAGQLSPVSGRLSAIAVHPTNPDVVYAGGAQGGVWKSTNATSAKPTWVPLTDHEASLAVGSIAIDPVNPEIVYVGTGEPNGSCDSYYG